MDGTPVAVMGADKFKIKNEDSGDDFWKDLNGKTLYVIYLFNARESNE